jgi:hypothetical protein
VQLFEAGAEQEGAKKAVRRAGERIAGMFGAVRSSPLRALHERNVDIKIDSI